MRARTRPRNTTRSIRQGASTAFRVPSYKPLRGFLSRGEAHRRHSHRTIEEALTPDKHLGDVDLSTLAAEQKPAEQPAAKAPSGDAPLTLGACLNLDDIERAAEKLLKPKAWGAFGLTVSPKHAKSRTDNVISSLLPQRSRRREEQVSCRCVPSEDAHPARRTDLLTLAARPQRTTGTAPRSTRCGSARASCAT